MTNDVTRANARGLPIDRHALEDAIERLLRVLDALDGDPDREPEDEHGGDILDEPHDDDVFTGADSEYSMGWHDEGSQLNLSAGRDDLEAELGATEEIDQVRRLETIEAWFHPDGEPELGWTGHGRGCLPGEPTDDREGDDERDCDLAGGSTDLEFDQGEYDGPGFIWGGNEDAHP